MEWNILISKLVAKAMLQGLAKEHIRRQMKTSEPRFKRLKRIDDPDETKRTTTYNNFP